MKLNPNFLLAPQEVSKLKNKWLERGNPTIQTIINLRAHEEQAQSPELSKSTIPSTKTIRNLRYWYLFTSWASFWVQLSLSIVSSVILVFANTARQGMDNRNYYLWLSGFAMTSIGTILALVNTLWTWNTTRLCKRIKNKNIEENHIVPTLRRFSQISVVGSIIGMFFTIIGAGGVVGTLTLKLLSMQGLVQPAITTAANSFQPVDIFLVQANTNTMLSHFMPLACSLFLQTRLPGSKVAKLLFGSRK